MSLLQIAYITAIILQVWNSFQDYQVMSANINLNIVFKTLLTHFASVE